MPLFSSQSPWAAPGVLVHPDVSRSFSEIVAAGTWKRDGYVFGLAVDGSDGALDDQGRRVIKSHAVLDQHWEPQGAQIPSAAPFSGTEFNPGGGADYVATEFTAQAAPAGSPLAGSPSCFIFESDALRLQPVVQYGTQQVYLIGQVTSPGITINSRTTNVATPIAALGLTSTSIAQMLVGDVVSFETHLCVITATNQGAGTVTLHPVVSTLSPALGSTATYTSTAWSVNCMRLAAARPSSATTITAGTKGPYAMATPIPAHVVPGCAVMFTSSSALNLVSIGHNRIASIDRSGAQHTFTLEKDIANLSYPSITQDGMVLFAPCIWTPQMATVKTQGPIDCGVYALELDFTLPEAEVTDPIDEPYSKTQIEAWLAAHPKAAKQCGSWYAAWFNTFAWDANRSAPNLAFPQNNRTKVRRDELDKPFELFGCYLNGGINVLTCNVHQRGVYRDANGVLKFGYLPGADQMATALTELLGNVSNADHRAAFTEWLGNYFAASRVRVLNDARTGWRIPDSKWLDREHGYPSYMDGNSGGVLRGTGVHKLVLPSAFRLCSGARRKAQVLWTRDWSIEFLEGVPVCITYWSCRDQEQPWTFILDAILHTYQGWAWSTGFFLRDTAHVADKWMKVHAINIWRG